MTVRLILARHGETDYNKHGLALGRADIPLNDTGHRQAECLRGALVGTGLSAVYASPLVRARATAEAIGSAHGLDVQLDGGLIEMDVGEVEGLTFPEVAQRMGRTLDVVKKLWPRALARLRRVLGDPP